MDKKGGPTGGQICGIQTSSSSPRGHVRMDEFFNRSEDVWHWSLTQFGPSFRQCGGFCWAGTLILWPTGVHAAANGDAPISPSITARLLSTCAQGPAREILAQPVTQLTEWEEEVLTQVAHALTNSEITDELHVSLSTGKTHLTNLMTKLDVRNRVELAIWAHETRRALECLPPRVAGRLQLIGDPDVSR